MPQGTNYPLSPEHEEVIRRLWDERSVRRGEGEASRSSESSR